MGERTTIRMKGELLSAAKRRAAEQNRTLTDFIEDAVRAALTASTKRTPVEIVVSTQTGGPLPGVDVIRTGALVSQLDDEKYLELEARLERERRQRGQ